MPGHGIGKLRGQPQALPEVTLLLCGDTLWVLVSDAIQLIANRVTKQSDRLIKAIGNIAIPDIKQ